MRRCYPIAIAAVLSFLHARAEEQPNPILTTVSSTVFSGYTIIPVLPPPTPTLSATISVRAAKRLMYEDSLMTPSGSRAPAMFILRRTGNTSETHTVYFELTGTASVDVDYIREFLPPPMGQPTVTNGNVQNVVFAPGEQFQYVQLQMAREDGRERFESIRLRILPQITLHGVWLPTFRPGARRCASIWISDQSGCIRYVSHPSGGRTCVEYRPVTPPPGFFVPDRCR